MSWPLSLTLLAACDGEGVPAPDVTAPAVVSGCENPSYEQAVDLRLPTDAPPLTQATRTGSCDEGYASTRLYDLTGDGRVDILALTDCADPTVGATHLRAWPGQEGGFGDVLTWGLPDGYGAEAFQSARSRADCSGPDDLPAFFYAELDGVPGIDLVVSESCADPTSEVWRVYRNTGTGFAPAESWPLDTRWSAFAFGAAREEAVCDGDTNLPAWGLADLDGDNAAELVITQSCVDPDVGVTYWEVYPGDGTGFPEEPMRWLVPPGLHPTALARPTPDCFRGLSSYFLSDLDGDARLELVIPSPCAATDSNWQVHPNIGGGFSAAGELLAGPWGLSRLVNQADNPSARCEAGTPAWALDDVDADGFADLSFLWSCTDPSVGDTRWDTWLGSATGFTTRTSAQLPAGYSPSSFLGAGSNELGCGGVANRPAWSRVDLDGDGSAEILVTEACDDPGVGTERWRVYRAVCE